MKPGLLFLVKYERNKHKYLLEWVNFLCFDQLRKIAKFGLTQLFETTDLLNILKNAVPPYILFKYILKLCAEDMQNLLAIECKLFNVRKRKGIDGKTLYCSCGGNEHCILRIKTKPVTECEEKTEN